METEDAGNRNPLFEALAKAQGEFRKPTLNRTAQVKKDGRLLYETHYADLEECIDCIKAPLAKHGLAFVQKVDLKDGQWVLVLKLVHSSAYFIESFFPLNFNQAPQQVGGNLTYFKRYQLAAFFGLAADFDDDGNATATDGDQFQFSPKQKQRPPTTTASNVQAPPAAKPPFVDPGKYVCLIGKKFKGKKIEEIDRNELGQYLEWLRSESEKSGKKSLQGDVLDFVTKAENYLSQF